VAKKMVVVKRKGSGEGSAADRAYDKAHPKVKEGSKAEEAYDRRMARIGKKKRG
jgi:hypothetical protein